MTTGTRGSSTDNRRQRRRTRTTKPARKCWRHRKHIDRWAKSGLVLETDWDGEPLIRTPPPDVDGGWWDPDAVEHVLRTFASFPQIDGRWRGTEFRLLDWQVEFIISIFGWRYPLDHPDPELAGTRIVRTAWIEIPRKNGKSTLAAGLGLYLFSADREQAPQVFAAAVDREQARNVFRPSREMALACKPLRKRLGRYGIQRNHLEHPVTGGVYRAVPGQGFRLHGLNVHGALIDEVHVHKTPDLIEALESGTGSRLQPLTFFITTADTGEEHSVYGQKREYLDMVASGSVVDPSFYGVVFGAPEDADPFAWETIYQANPGVGWTCTRNYLENKAAKAKAKPSELNSYLRLHLNRRTKQQVRFIPIHRWDRGAGAIDDAEWSGTRTWAGLDLSATTDMTAFVMVAHQEQGGYITRPMFWMPEERAVDLERETRIPYSQWADEGLILLTEGDVVDYAQMRGDIDREIKRLGCKIDEIGYDRYMATETVIEMEKKYTMVPIGQGYISMNAPLKELERLVFGSTAKRVLLRHGGHRVLRWHIDCLTVRRDQSDNVRPVKPDRDKSSKRIDGAVALTMAIDRASRHRPKKKHRARGV